MYNFLITRFLHCKETFNSESPPFKVDIAVEFTDVEESVVLCWSCLLVEINEVVDRGIFHARIEELVMVMRIKAQISGGMEVVVPTEVVGMVIGFKPGGGLAFHVEINDDLAVVVFGGAEILPPLSVDVEIADLISKRDEPRMSCDGG